jgi:electron transfer flavoprotein alpha subunit
MKTLVIAEHNNTHLKPSTLNTLTAALQCNKQVDVLVIGYQCQAVAESLSSVAGLEKISLADHAVYQHQLAENTAALIAACAASYEAVLAPATTFGKNVLPRVAALLNVSMLSDVTRIVSPTVYERPMYAGNVIATMETTEAIKVMTVRSTAFSPTLEKSNTKAPIEIISTVIENTLTQFEHQSLTESKRPELTAARVIVSGGRGLKSAENFQMIEQLADELGAAVGASRAAVDAGFVPNDYQVGQTGKVVAPELYIAIGISGAIQHLAGMKDSKVIVAINSDAEAPIFEIADYGLVGDLFTLLPALQAALKKAKGVVA